MGLVCPTTWLTVFKNQAACFEDYIVTKPLNSNYSFPEWWSAEYIHNSLTKKERRNLPPFQVLM